MTLRNICIIALACSAPIAAAPIELQNKCFHVTADNFVLSNMRSDPTGNARFHDADWNRFAAPLVLCDQRTDDAKDAAFAAWRGHLLHRLIVQTCPGRREAAFRIAPGSHAGFTFHVSDNHWAEKVSLYVATYLTKNSAVTLSVRRESATGEIIAQKRFENVADNSVIALPLPMTATGTIWVGLSDVKGEIAWWGSNIAPAGGAETFINDEAKPQVAFGADIELRTRLAPIEASWRLDGHDLIGTIDVQAGASKEGLPSQIEFVGETRWQRDGYEISPKTAAFDAYYSAVGQYFTAWQMKRRDTLGISMFGSERITARGIANADWHIESAAAGMTVEAKPDALLHQFTLNTSLEPGTPLVTLRLHVEPAGKPLPDSFPRFRTSDGDTGTLTTSFFCDRALSYPPAPGPAAWFEWNGLIRNWLDLPRLRDPERSVLATVPITDEGYVHTWGGTIGWPFPDGNKYDTRHFDTNPRYILGCHRWVMWRRDAAFLREQLARIRKAMAYQLKQLKGESGLIITNSKDVTGRHGALGSNYWDILPFGHIDAYCNIAFYASLGAMAELEELAQRWAPEIKDGARTPHEYRELDRRTRELYNNSLWDDIAGRYIGCIDIDGRRHDYGFTFVNLEAMAYGLASREQAQRIYKWMETEPTSTGKADIYSAFEFAPRATTFHNPIRNDPKDVERAGRPPWWHLDWVGTPFGEQCQDGGAILYTSYYDISARARLISPENAWQRYGTILKRYMLPDHLCGGPPLSHGEIPQQENPGAVGVDLPFPESGLVPASMLYTFMGVMPEPGGLRIQPRLPRGIDHISCGPVAYGTARLSIEVSQFKVSIDATIGERKVALKLPIPKSGDVLVPPESLYQQ